jgi:hypothetical protein
MIRERATHPAVGIGAVRIRWRGLVVECSGGAGARRGGNGPRKMN